MKNILVDGTNVIGYIGEQFAVQLVKEDSGLVSMQLLVEDDGIWHKHGNIFSSFWLPDLIRVLAEAKVSLDTSARFTKMRWGYEVTNMYKYTCLYRPPSWNNLPKGWELLERPSMTPNNFERRTDLPVSEYRYGVVGFATPLSEGDCKEYGLQYLGVTF